MNKWAYFYCFYKCNYCFFSLLMPSLLLLLFFYYSYIVTICSENCLGLRSELASLWLYSIEICIISSLFEMFITFNAFLLITHFQVISQLHISARACNNGFPNVNIVDTERRFSEVYIIRYHNIFYRWKCIVLINLLF